MCQSKGIERCLPVGVGREARKTVRSRCCRHKVQLQCLDGGVGVLSGGCWVGFSVVVRWCVFVGAGFGLWGVLGMGVAVGRGW